jgi:hypothetical protein
MLSLILSIETFPVQESSLLGVPEDPSLLGTDEESSLLGVEVPVTYPSVMLIMMVMMY